MHFITNGYRTLFKDQLNPSKAMCSFQDVVFDEDDYYVSHILCKRAEDSIQIILNKENIKKTVTLVEYNFFLSTAIRGDFNVRFMLFGKELLCISRFHPNDPSFAGHSST